MTWWTWCFLAGAAFAAGLLNAVAGGGSFLTFPALVLAGVPPIPANATSAVALSPGYLGSVAGFRAELRTLPRSRLAGQALASGLGGVIGALLLLATPTRLFTRVVPWLVLFATVLFAAGPRRARPRQTAGGDRPWARDLGILPIAVYGGYFNGGLGYLLLAHSALAGETDLNRANALKNLNSLVLSLTSVAAFICAGAVRWPQALVMMAAAAAGGFFGARLARRLPAALVRGVIVATGLVMAVILFRK